MKKIATLLFILINFYAFSQQNNIVPGEFIIRLHHSEKLETFIIQASAAGLNEIEVKRNLSANYNIWLIGLETANGESELKKLRELPSIRFAQFNHEVQLRATEPDDASFSQQWSLKNTGQSGGTEGADIDATLAWDVTTGGLTALGDTIVVAVIDGGFQLTHPDLVDNYFVNYHEIPGNGIDDDNNGYIDDVNGWDAYGDDGTIPSDQHGTHVSGIIGAKGDNEIGISGVNWNVKVLPVAGSSGNEATVVAAYSYVAAMRQQYNETNGEKGAFVVSTNSSFGVDQGDPADYPIWCGFYDDLGELGILSAGATANANFNIDQTGDIPTACVSEFMIAVTNSTRNDAKYNGAGFGITTIDIASPGSAIYSTVTNSNYGNLTGTSMATPHVAGSIALMYAAACDVLIQDYKNSPATLALTMRDYLFNGAEQIAAFDGLVAGSRRLNVNGAIEQVQTYVCATDVPPVANFNAPGRNGCPGLEVNFNNLSSSNSESYAWSFPGGNPLTSNLEDPVVTYNDFGDYDVTLIVTNIYGSDTITYNNYVAVTNTGTRIVFTEDFESNDLVGSGFIIDNPDQSNTWEIYSASGNGSSNFSLGINMFNNQGNAGQRDYLDSPVFSLANTSENRLELKYAHRRRSAGQEDSLIVSISPDNGLSWYRLDAKGGGSNSDNPLATNVLLNSSFTPSSAADWCSGTECLDLDISAWDGAEEVKFRLEAFNDAGNNIYVDNIQVSGICTVPLIQPVVASFSVDQETICTGTPVVFENLSENAVSFNWTFEGGQPTTSNAANPQVVYTGAGTFNVELIAWNSAYADTLNLIDFVTVAESPVPPVISVMDNVLTASGTGNFQWYFNGSPLPGETSQSITVTETGDYYVVVSANGCSVGSEPYYFSTESVNSVDNDSNFRVYPNPVKDNLRIENVSEGSFDYQLFDSAGRLIISGNAVKSAVISIHKYEAGIYSLRIQTVNAVHVLPVIHY